MSRKLVLKLILFVVILYVIYGIATAPRPSIYDEDPAMNDAVKAYKKQRDLERKMN